MFHLTDWNILYFLTHTCVTIGSTNFWNYNITKSPHVHIETKGANSAEKNVFGFEKWFCSNSFKPLNSRAVIPKIAARELVHFQVVVYLGLDWIFPHFNLIHVEIFHTAISYGKANIVQFVFICCSSFTVGEWSYVI